jgi:hypothetical protein
MFDYHPEPLEGPAATCPHLLRGHLQDLGNLFGRQAPHVREDQQGAIGFAQLRQAGLHPRKKLLVLQLLLWRLLRGSVRPV